MDLLDYILYTLARIGVLLVLVLLGAFVGEILFPAIVSFLPYSAIEVKEFFTNDTVQSAIALIVVCLFFLWIFYDDGKRHTAYENWSSVNITAVLLIMFIVYFIPAIFRDSFHAEGKADVFYRILYYPCSCLGADSSDTFMLGIVLTEVVIVLCALVSYVFAYKRYVHKHPSVLNERKTDLNISIDDEEASDSE
jgi:hypothetical protein